MTTSPIRPFVAADIPQVAHLHESVFETGGHANNGGGACYREYFTHVFLDNPWRDEELPSLVYEDDGRIVGFLGVVPRWMSMNGERLRAAIASQFVADPTSRTALVSVRLVAAFLDGPQDLSIADEGNDVSRTIWEGLGGTTALLRSMYWTRALRPARCFMAWLSGRGFGSLAAVATPASRIVDAVATRLPRSHFFQTPPPEPSADLGTDTVLARLPELAPGALRVEYDQTVFEWLLERARECRAPGTVRKAVVRSGPSVRGWYVYHLVPNETAEVLQVAARPSSIGLVLDHLFYDAWRHGAAAVSGRVEPSFLQAYFDKYCVFRRCGPWMLVHARRPDLLRPFQNGNAFFSRFDGEWCLGFQAAAPRAVWSQ